MSDQHTFKNLKVGDYVLNEDDRDPRIFDSFAQAYPHIEGRDDIFGCTYHGHINRPLRM